MSWLDKWNAMYCNSIEVHTKVCVKWLVETLTEARAQYSAGTPIMTDNEYDKFEDYLRTNDPHNPFLDKVGAEEDEVDIFTVSGLFRF